jgi:hypothetical protein
MASHMIQQLRANRGQEDGDRERAAQVILDLVDLDEPPLKLPGSYGLARSVDIVERQSAEDRKWAFLSERTDFQEVAP